MSNPLAVVIEDDFDASNIVAEALKLAGYEVQIIRHGAVAQEELKKLVPALIALDMHLPGVDGAQLLAQIRADERLVQTKVIMLTADDHMANRSGHDADIVLLKPATFSQIRLLAQRLRPQL